jgi:hypothetical protein
MWQIVLDYAKHRERIFARQFASGKSSEWQSMRAPSVAAFPATVIPVRNP